MKFISNPTSILLSLCIYSTCMLTSPLSWAGHGGGMDTGGGDPMQIEAVSYPDVAGLVHSMEVVQAKVSASTYPESFKASLLAEMHSLQVADKYRMLSSLIILGPGSGPEGYKLPQDAYQFISLGGMTETNVGAPVYFSERVTHYTTNELAKVLLHEVIHHVVPQGLSEDEVYVNDLTSSIFSGVSAPKLAQSFVNSAYFRKDFISKKQFLDAFDFAGFAELTKNAASWFGGPQWRDQLVQYWRVKIEEKLPENLADFPSEEFPSIVMEAMYSERLGALNLSVKANTMWIMIQLARDLNPSGPELDLGHFGCRKGHTGFLAIFNKKCEGNDIIRMRDLYVPGN